MNNSLPRYLRFVLLVILLGVFSLCRGAAPDLSKPTPFLRLPDGRVLQQVEFKEFKPNGVLLKHKAGSAFVLYESLPDDFRAAAELKRPGGPRYLPGDTTPDPDVYAGQVFIQTKGAGAYKFAEVTVYAFDAKLLGEWDSFSRPVRLGKPVAKVKTDGDGRFKISVPKDAAVFFFAQGRRLVVDAYERDEWRVASDSFKKRDETMLSSANVQSGWTKVEIDESND